MGYTTASVLQTIMLTYTFFLVANTASFGIGCYLIAKIVTKEISNILHIADKRLAQKKEHSLAMKRFIQLIEWHALMKQLSRLKSNLLKNVICYKCMPVIEKTLRLFS